MKRKRKESTPELDPAQWQEKSLERFRPLISAEEYSAMLEEIKLPLETALRRNPLKASAQAPADWRQRYHWQLEQVPFCADGFRVIEGEDSTPPSQTLEHRMGHYYIQEAASMLPVELFHIESGKPELCLDLAASPGGKTTHLIARGMDRSLVMANDSSAGRISALRIVLQNWGAVNNMITQFPGEKFGQWFPEVFDRVLLDAPCSMQGLRTAESHGVRPVTEKEIHGLAKRQASLLASALQAVKVGGEVVYSTCTLVPEEDEAVIAAILDQYGSKVEVLATPLQAPGITQLGEIALPEIVGRSLRLWPHRFHTAGFFACLLRKKEALGQAPKNPPARPFDRTGFALLNKKETQAILIDLQGNFDYSLEQTLADYDLVLARHQQRIYAFPSRMMSEFADLPVQSAGLLVGEETPDGFLPAHEWISRFFGSFVGGRLKIDAEDVDSWLRGDDLVHSPASSGILLLVDEDGRYLGRGKALPSRIKNMLPRRLL